MTRPSAIVAAGQASIETYVDGDAGGGRGRRG
jgi:hypothetical protein